MENNLKTKIEHYIPWNEKEEKDKEVMLKYLDSFDNLLMRENEIAHFTASGWIVNKERTKVIMVYHNIYDSWSWTGGHADGESNLLEVALTEAKEETGIKNLYPVCEDIYSLEILCVNGHKKRGKYVSSHIHLNLTYLLEADETDELRIKADENSGVTWVEIENASMLSNEPWFHGIYDKLNEKLLVTPIKE